MTFVKKSWQDHLSASFGQIDEGIRSKTGNDGLIIGGVMEGTATAVEDGDFAALHFDANQNLMVNLAGTEPVVVQIGTVNTGTIGLVSSVGAIVAGTQNTLGTVGVLNSGSVVVTAGTIVAGTIGNINAGSIVVTAGTIGDLDTVGTVGVLNAGSVVVTAGTVSTLNTVGTVGVINSGTVSVIPAVHVDKFGVLIDCGTAAIGTVVGSTAGSAVYVTDLIVSCDAANTVSLGNGGTANLIFTGYFAENGGVCSNFITPLYTSPGSALVWSQAGTGNVAVIVQGFKD